MGTELKKVVLNPQEMIKGFHLTQIQDNIALAVNQLSNQDFSKGNMLSFDLISGQDNILNHGLDREVQGWTIVNKNANSDVWQSTTLNNFKNKQIIMRSSANVSVKIYFF